MNNFFDKDVQNLEALVLFGSQARGDSDAGSDVDIAAFGQVSNIDELINLKRAVASTFTEVVNVSTYSTTTALTMAHSGSLFLWHLKLEGKIISQNSNWYESLLSNLRPYSMNKALRDLSTFAVVLNDIQTALESSTPTLTLLFEASTLFAVLRSMGMIVSMIHNRACFSRLEPVQNLRTLLGDSFCLGSMDIETLYRAKLYYSRKSQIVPMLDTVRCRTLCHQIRETLNIVKGQLL